MPARRSLSVVLPVVFGAASLVIACGGTGPTLAPTAAVPVSSDPTVAPSASPGETVQPLAQTTPSDPPASSSPAPVPTLTPTPTLTSAPTPVVTPETTPGPSNRAELVVAGRTLRIEFALTYAQRALGLSGRERLDPDAGMLFVFPDERTRAFWMRDTLIPLDLVYLDSDWVVVGIHTMQPEPDTPVSLLRRYPSAEPARYALEINAGLAMDLGIEIGDVIDVSGLVIRAP